MKRWGAMLLFIGIGSFIMPIFGMQFRLLNMFGDQQGAGVVLAVIGLILFVVASARERKSAAPAQPPQPPPPKPAKSRTAEQQFSNVTTNRCAQCGNAVDSDGMFCGDCGAPLAARCPNPRCGQVLAPGKRFCTACGTPL